MATVNTTPLERRLSYCPECQMIRGIPFRVNGGPRLLVIAYHCESCGDEWVVPSAPHDIQLQLTHEHSLYDVRSKVVHKGDHTGRSWGWDIAEHLVMAGHVFPLVVKLMLEQDGHYRPTGSDSCA
jgi:hypothetical protein